MRSADYEEFKRIEWGELRLRPKVLVNGRGVVDNRQIKKYGR